MTSLMYLFSISDFDEEGLQLQSLYKQSPANGLIVLWSQAWVGQPRCTQPQHLAECTHWLKHAPLLLLFVLLILATVPLICCPHNAVALSVLITSCHTFDEALQLWAELPLLTVVQPPVQSLVDGHTQRLDDLKTDKVTTVNSNFLVTFPIPR